jgi:hypothetical protein
MPAPLAGIMPGRTWRDNGHKDVAAADRLRPERPSSGGPAALYGRGTGVLRSYADAHSRNFSACMQRSAAQLRLRRADDHHVAPNLECTSKYKPMVRDISS